MDRNFTPPVRARDRDTGSYLAKNKRGIWEIRWSEQGTGGAGGAWRSRTQSTGTASRTEAEAVYGSWLSGVGALAKAAASGGDVGFDVVLKAYEKALDVRGTGGATQRLYLGKLKAWFGSSGVGGLDVAGYVRDRRDAGTGDPSIRRELGVLRAVLSRGVKERLIKPDVVPVFDLPPPGSPREVFLDEEREGRLWALAMGWSLGWNEGGRRWKGRLSPVTIQVALALDTGARKGALEDLTWSRVAGDCSVIDFRPWGRGVSNKRRVAVPVGSRLRDVLLRARREAVRGGKGDLVIWQDTRREFESFLAWAGPEFDDVTWHVLRHTFATLMLRAGVTLWDVAGLLGDDYSTVQRVYGHHCSVGLGKSIDARWC